MTQTELHTHFSQQLLGDMTALEQMLEANLFERNTVRIGAEQEFCTIDYNLQPAMIAMQMLDTLQDPHFTTELALFNLEANLDPRKLEGNCFSALENDLIGLLTKANMQAHKLGAKIILTGILPSIRHKDVVLENITPNPRYRALNDAILESRGGAFKLHIMGLDELITHSESVLFEACNTSFQVHYQTEPDLVDAHYNWAQMISGPVLAACTNSPLFLGKRLWSETRIALFHQSADTRKNLNPMRHQRERVTFGQEWSREGALGIFRDTVKRYGILLPLQIDADSLAELRNGSVPKLKALTTHNGTVYRWNRLCYGITEGKPHVRIENRYLPSGPSIMDEVANAAFWTGLMHGMPAEMEDLPDRFAFDQVKENFMRAAKSGLATKFHWPGDKTLSAKKILMDILLPIAKEGLTKAGVHDEESAKYLGIIEGRVRSGRTGSVWMLESFNGLKELGNVYEAAISLTEGIYSRQKNGSPAHTWEPLEREEGDSWDNKFRRVEQIMSSDLITLRPRDLVSMAVNIMLWSNIHHLPVEDEAGHLLGLLTSDKLLDWLNRHGGESADTKVEAIMIKDVVTCEPDMDSSDAYDLMQAREIGCLPVLSDNKLVGILTWNDYVKLMGYLLKQQGK